MSALAQITDWLQVLHGDLIANGGGKPPRLQPVPRPVTEADRARKRLEDRQFDDLVGEVYAAMDRWRINNDGGGA